MTAMMRARCRLLLGAAAIAARACVLPAILVVTASLAQAVTVSFTTAGTSTWNVPAGVTSVTVEAWGGGGAGGGATANPAKGGGGAGGQYARKVVAVTPGNPYTVVVGAGATGGTGNGASGGDSTFAAAAVVAKGGAGGTGGAGAADGAAGVGSTAGGIGDVVYAGGSGSSATSSGAGGAGGGGAGSGGAGGSASELVAGTGRSVGGGSGGAGRSTAGAGNAGSAAGGGGGGGYATTGTDRNGGNGGAGQVVITYSFPSVVSIVRASSNPTAAGASVSWIVTFSTSVTGVDATDFSLVPGGATSGAGITGVSGSGATWTVTANTGTGTTGTLGLNLIDNNSIAENGTGMVLGGTASGDGSFTGEVYTLQVPAPVLGKTSSTSSAVVGDVITFTLTASNPFAMAFANVVLTDVLPAGMSYSTHVAGSGTIGVSGQTVTWTIPALPAGGSAQLVLAVSLTAKGTLVNTVTSPGSAPASATVLVLANAITHFRMDEAVDSWSGAAGEVIDSGGTALHGKRLTTTTPTSTNAVTPPTAIAAQYPSVVGGFCNAGRFDGKGVVQVADSPLFDYTTQLSASAWVYPTAYPSSDLYSILSNDVNYEFHLNPSGRLYWWWNSSTLTSAATVPLNQWTHIAITFSSAAGAGRQRIYINGVADTNTNNWTGSLATNNCPFYIGGDISTGSGCALIPGRNFYGMIDEVKLYNYELGAAEVQADMTLGRSCSGAFDHIRIEHDGVASVCAPETVTVKACLNASCSTLYAGNVTVNLSPTGWSGGDTFTFSGGVTSRQLNHGTAGNVTLGAVNVSPAPANAVARCFAGGNETCVMNFANASCTFDAAEIGGNPQTRLFTKLAGVPFNLDVLALSTTTTVNTGYADTVTVDLVDASASACPTGASLNTPTNITYAAGDQGRKPVAFSYSGAARNVRVRAKVGTSTPACSYDSFTIRPQSFSSVTSGANADAAGTNATATPSVKAGNVFAIVANTGVAGYDGNPKADPSLLEWLNAPSGGRSAPGTGTLDGSTPGNLAFSAAASAATGNGASGSFTYDEAGYFRFKANGVYDDTFVSSSGDKANGDCIVGSFSNALSGGRYGCNFGNPSQTDHFGRFIPDHFDTAVTQGCAAGAFTYSGQPFPMTVTARNLAGGTTQNYSGTFARNLTLAARNAADTATNPGPGVLAPVVVAAGILTGGVVALSPTYAFTSKETAPTSVKVRADDGEASSLRSPASLSVEGTAMVRSGRARLSNAYGSELLDLPVLFRTEFYDGAGWILNVLDSCTGDASLGAANAVSLALSLSPAGLNTCVRDSGSPGRSGAGCAAVSPAAKRYLEGTTPTLGFAGNFNLWLQAPGAGQFGSATMTATVPAWLGAVPPAIATFGRYKSPLIYRRENY